MFSVPLLETKFIYYAVPRQIKLFAFAPAVYLQKVTQGHSNEFLYGDWVDNDIRT